MQTLLPVLVTLGLVVLQFTQGEVAKPDPDEDVLGEAIADGFIVDVKGTTSSVRNKRLIEAAITPDSLNPEGKTFQSLQEDSVTTVGHKVSTRSTKEVPKNENAETSPTMTFNQDTTTLPTNENNGDTTAQTAFPELRVIEMKLLPEETINENMNIEGSGMLLETLPRKLHKNPLPSTSISTPVGGLPTTTHLIWPTEMEEGSGMDRDGNTSDGLTSTPKTTTILENIEEKASETDLDAEAPSLPNSRNSNNLPNDAGPTTSAQAEEGTPAWLIIFAFCMTLGAILCVFAGIATKDMWYGPRRRSLNITPQDSNEEYGKSATLPLSEKEQELVTLMNTGQGQKNDKDFTVVSLEEAPEKEYLM
ncbi:uncharacterized protein cd44a [Colossoma macropomum]|uniref:uncharacterized protein cd44a n=1 Tax=Colossoma macropomum TaxID=42526 RepID=UPI0018656740|nr:uncharacterized protein cd44a [Colossoma macropomum]